MTRHRTLERSRRSIGTSRCSPGRHGTWVIFRFATEARWEGRWPTRDPAAEQPAVCLALDAVMEVASTGGVRDVAATYFSKARLHGGGS